MPAGKYHSHAKNSEREYRQRIGRVQSWMFINRNNIKLGTEEMIYKYAAISIENNSNSNKSTSIYLIKPISISRIIMRTQHLLALSGLLLAGNVAVASKIDHDDVPSRCWAACGSVVGTAERCDHQHDDDDYAEMQCICNWDQAKTQVPLCAACIDKYDRDNDTDDDDDDDDYDDDDNGMFENIPNRRAQS